MTELPDKEFVFHCKPIGNKPEENQAYYDRINETLKTYSPHEHVSKEDKAFGVKMFDLNFGSKVDFDHVFINGKSVNSICEKDFDGVLKDDIEFKKTLVTAAAMGRKDKLDVCLPDPETGEMSKPIAMQTKVRDEMKNVSILGEIKSLFANLGNSAKRNDALTNIKVLLGLENSKDAKHLLDLKQDVRIAHVKSVTI